MGVVYLAVREADSSAVALKVLRPDLADDRVYRKRFEREGKVASRLSHPHLVPVVDVGEEAGLLYIAGRFVEGLSLREWLDEQGPLPSDELTSIVGGVASGLDELHRQGIVHRDVKPANVMLDIEGSAFLTDFGLARSAAHTVLTKTGHVVGTPEYLAPEVIRGVRARPASDVYALGCLAYACACGKTPFAGRTLADTCLAHLKEEPADPRSTRPELPDTFAWALLTALAKEPAGRPETATAYAQLLRSSAAR